MLWPRGECLAYNLTNFPNLLIRFPNFFSVLNTTWIAPSFSCRYPSCVCTHPIDLTDIHLLCYVHANECIGTHDVVHDTSVAIAQDVGFHVGWEQLHVLPSNMFNFFRQWINIVLTKDGICTLVDIVIVDPMCDQIYFPNLAPPKDFRCGLSQKQSYYD
jgi:hypothetical protein